MVTKYEVELAVCQSYGSDSGSWHVEPVEIETDIHRPTKYQLLEMAEKEYDALISRENRDDDWISAIAFYSSAEMIKCEHCGEYYRDYDEECQNPDCPGG